MGQPMRKVLPDRVEKGRFDGRGHNGHFFIRCHGKMLCVVCSNGGGWDHVSVSRPSQCPTWEDMAAIKDLFFEDDECVMQLHPPNSDYVNNHPYCLHLWRPQTGAEIAAIMSSAPGLEGIIPYPETPAPIPRPPSWMVGIKQDHNGPLRQLLGPNGELREF